LEKVILYMHYRVLTEDEFTITGEHSVRSIEFDHITQNGGQISVVRGEDISDWIVSDLSVDDWSELKDSLSEGEYSIDELEEYLTKNQIEL